jgi:hypothetical protein
MKYQFILFIILVVLNVNKVSSQNYSQTIRGSVKDKETQQPVVGAIIYINTTTPVMTSITDNNGLFKLNHVPVGRHIIKVSYIGYKDITISDLIVNSAKEAIITIELEEEVKSLKEHKVKASNNANKTNNELITVSGRLFTSDQTNRFAGSLGDPSRMAANFAGVSGVGGQRNDIVIRGNSPMGLLWRLEGIDIPNPNHFSSQGSTGGPISILNNNTLANSDFITSAFPAEYGNCLSGVFDLKIRNGNNEKHEYIGQVGFNGFEIGAEGPINKKKNSSYLINYRYSTLGVFDKLGISLTFGGIPKYQDITFKFNFPKTKTGHWQITGIGGISSIALLDSKKDSGDLSFGQTYKNDIYNGTKMGVFIISNQLKINKKSYFKSIVSATYQKRYTHVDSLNNLLEKTLIYAEKTTYIKAVAHLYYHVKINAKHSLRAGSIFSNLGANLQDSFRNNFGKIQTLRQYSGNDYLFQLYSQWKFNVSEKLTVNSGIHMMRYFLNKSYSLEPRLGAKFLLTPKKNISTGIGMHSQLQPTEVYYSQIYNNSLNAYVRTNTNLGFSKSIHAVVGYEQNLNKNIRLKIELYRQELYQIPIDGVEKNAFSLLNFGADFAALPARDSLLNNGKGNNTGIEITLEKYFSKGFYWLFTSSFFDSKYTSSLGKEFNTAFNGKYVINGLAGYELKCGKNKNNIFSINLKTTVAGGRRFTPIDLQASQAAGDVVYNWNMAYSEQFKTYFRADIRIGFKKNSKRVTQEWAIDIQNTFNSKNPLQQSYNISDGSIKTEYQQGFLPIALYRIQF